ncbi:MAG: bifunctional UDP-N-acetylglucosamine diphosphorylase/glucosamine-1-phosphate N-acetyltransferase GlmU [Alphaproteobacteria bacterium]|nr:bifunctional UDP-N-acetylglucosamine diphosphorylase/glucosamine-1-phosphate N-acetyltransferase GlmU [Alphaproteobacteria bacterium]
MLSVIILAAGQSKRMNSKVPKVLHPLGGLSMIQHVLKSVQKVNPHQIIIVTSPTMALEFKGYKTVIQEVPKGTGHAVQIALEALDEKATEVMIVCGDTPLIHSKTLQTLNESDADLTLVAMRLQSQNHAYGLVFQDIKEKPKQIIEFKDATTTQRQIRSGNAGVYKIKKSLLKELLPFLNNNNAAGEYYLTDLVGLAYDKGYNTHMIEAEEEEFQGINNRVELAKAETILQNRWRHEKMMAGVTLVQPETIFFSHDTEVGRDSRIGPFVTFGEKVCIQEDVTILPYCHIEHSAIEEGVSVGPFAHLRGNTLLQKGSSIGNFVEIKGSKIGKKSKAKHLSYIGDTDVGEKVNIGAGTVTCNYDGFKKSKTILKDGSMIGANTSLVAPLTIGEGAIVAAGSTVTESVPENALAVARSVQTTKSNWAARFREKHQK